MDQRDVNSLAIHEADPFRQERRACHQSAKPYGAEERERRYFRIELPLAIPMRECLIIAVGHSKAVIPFSANPGHSGHRP
jgi:hypothetical protein